MVPKYMSFSKVKPSEILQPQSLLVSMHLPQSFDPTCFGVTLAFTDYE